MQEGHDLLQGQQVSFNRPRPETDRLFMNIGGDDVIEMQHPAVPADVPEHHRPGKPMMRLGAIASGKPLVKEDQLRLEFAARHQCIGTDTEFDQVIIPHQCIGTDTEFDQVILPELLLSLFSLLL